MVRVFTVSFWFRERPCTALVSLNNKDDYNPSFSVHYLDKEVEKILPQRKLVFSLVHGVENHEAVSDKLAEDLVKKTSEAISHYLEAHA